MTYNKLNDKSVYYGTRRGQYKYNTIHVLVSLLGVIPYYATNKAHCVLCVFMVYSYSRVLYAFKWCYLSSRD